MGSIAISPTADRRRSGARPGYTLTELLVVLAIAAAIATAATPLLRPSAATAAQTFAREIATLLDAARAKAFATGQETIVFVDVEARRAWVEGGASAKAGDRLRLRAVGAAPERRGTDVIGFRYFPDGGATGGEIDVEGGGRVFRVRIDWLTGAAVVADAA